MPFTVTEGSIQSVWDSPWPAFSAGLGGGSITLGDRAYASYATLYRKQPNVRTVVSFLARNIAQLGTHVYRRASDTDREHLTGHPLSVLLNQPNPWMTRYRSMVRLVSDMAIYDDAFWIKVKTADRPLSLVPVPPFMMRPAPDDTNWLAPDNWELYGPTGRVTLPAKDVLHFTGYDPADPRLGFSPMETLRELLAEEYEAGRWRQQMWRNGARSSGYVTRPPEAPRWSDPARENFRAYLKDQYTGSGQEAGGTILLEDGMTYVPSGLDPKAAQYIEARKLTREEVASAYHIPLPMIGILDNATYSNITEQHKQLYADTLGPWLTMIQEELLLQLQLDVPDMADVYVEFNIGEKLKGSFDEQANSLSRLVGAPILTRNEGRAMLNRNALADGDELITPMNVIVGGLASPADTAPGDTAGPGAPAELPPPPAAAGEATGAPLAKDRRTSRRQVKARASVDESDAQAAEELLRADLERQRAQVLAATGAKTWRGRRKASVGEVFNVDRWDRELAKTLLEVNLLLATSSGRRTLKRLGLDLDYDDVRTEAWLKENASHVAGAFNHGTQQRVAAALDAPDPQRAVKEAFEVVLGGRLASLVQSQATSMTNWGAKEAGNQAAYERGYVTTKTWLTGSNPRASHAALNGETVGIDELFSNGASWPGDSTPGAEEAANCNCECEISTESSEEAAA